MVENQDGQADLQALTFDDLLSFAFQVAKGMEFLSSKNVRNQWTKLWNIYLCQLVSALMLQWYSSPEI